MQNNNSLKTTNTNIKRKDFENFKFFKKFKKPKT